MPLKARSILRDWQEIPVIPAQPTCYERRDPMRPWLHAPELGYDDFEDREAVHEWMASTATASSIGALQSRTKTGKEREEAIRANIEHRAESRIAKSLQRVADAMAPHPQYR